MNQIIKILDCKSGKELEIVSCPENKCKGCFYEKKSKCPNTVKGIICIGIIFKEVKKAETK
jgi:hypothetical protein